jgi:hypothetical protein
MDKKIDGRADKKLMGAFRGCSIRLKPGFLNSIKTITYKTCANHKYRPPYKLQGAIIAEMVPEER